MGQWDIPLSIIDIFIGHQKSQKPALNLFCVFSANNFKCLSLMHKSLEGCFVNVVFRVAESSDDHDFWKEQHRWQAG
jgi:hypothetical protein